MRDSDSIKIINTVASGGTAVLFKAIQTSLDRVVAVKRLHQHLTDDENFTRRFILEAKAAASLDHENIVHVIDFGQDDDGGYQMVMEFVEGESLSGILERWRPIKPELALAIVHQICLGLEHAHSKGIVHRDIKPGNVMLTANGRVKITDFGLAKLTQAATSQTAANSILGTPMYMSPEQAFGESVDQRSDLFSLGTVLYELVTGKQPFAGENYMGVIQNIINKDVPRVRTVNENVPEAVERIIGKALARDRDNRFQSARAFREAIESYVGIVELQKLADTLKVLLNRSGETQLLSDVSVAPRPTEKKRGRKGGAVAVVVLVLLAAATVAMVVEPSLLTRLSARMGGPEPLQSSGMGGSEAIQLDFEAGLPPLPGDGAAATPAGDAGTDPTAADPAGDTTTDTAVDAAGPAADTTDGPATGSTDTLLTDTARVDGADAAAGTPGANAPAEHAAPQTATPAATADGDPVAEGAPAPTPEPPAPRPGFLSINASPAAEIYVDGIYKGNTPPALSLKLVGGPHRLECRRPGFEGYSETIRIIPGELSRRNVTLRALTGRIDLATQSGTQVYIDGRLVGVTPLREPIEVDAGDHTVSLKKPGFNTWSSTITISAKETIPLRITLSPSY